MVTFPIFIFFIDHIFGCIIGGEVPDLVNECFESANVKHGFLFSSVKKFFLPENSVSLAHVGEDEENFVKDSQIGIIIT